MATLREVKNRIRSVISTRRITAAMETVAAANLRRAQQRAEETKPYAEKLNSMLSHLASASSGESPPVSVRGSSKVLERPELVAIMVPPIGPTS